MSASGEEAARRTARDVEGHAFGHVSDTAEGVAGDEHTLQGEQVGAYERVRRHNLQRVPAKVNRSDEREEHQSVVGDGVPSLKPILTSASVPAQSLLHSPVLDSSPRELLPASGQRQKKQLPHASTHSGASCVTACPTARESVLTAAVTGSLQNHLLQLKKSDILVDQ